MSSSDRYLLAIKIIERASASVLEICPSGASFNLSLVRSGWRIRSRNLSILSCRALALGLHLCGLRAIRGIQRIQIARDVLLDVLLAFIDLARSQVAVSTVHRLELAAFDGDDRLREQLELAAHRNEALADVTDAFAVAAHEVVDHLEVRGKPARQPHQLDIALGFASMNRSMGYLARKANFVSARRGRRHGAGGRDRAGTIGV
jgi:hypothetical protein